MNKAPLSPYTILSLHSPGAGDAARDAMLAQDLPDCRIVPINLSPTPETAVSQIRSRLNEPRMVLIGEGLAGFYADFFNACWDVPCVLVNPIMSPDDLPNNQADTRPQDMAYLQYMQKRKARQGYSIAPQCIILTEKTTATDWTKATACFQSDLHILVRSPASTAGETNRLLCQVLAVLQEDISTINFSDPFEEDTYRMGQALAALKNPITAN